MTERTDQAAKLMAAQKYFRSLEIEGWEETSSPVEGGGQATILIVKRADGVRGAFRFAAEADEQTLERFSREIRILSGYEHPNIMRILAHSKETSGPWYISDLGEPFGAYWKRCREQLVDDPEQLVSNAVDIIRQLADGLAPLHDRGVVHRDIKPRNIIISKGPGAERPVLIDFGLAHVESEPRLSDVNETVGNLRFSPDVAMYHMDNVTPWLDVHNLAQLFMWLARVHPHKDWSRALDWRWVTYDSRLSEASVHSIRALTAQSSEQIVSPKNAKELISLIDNLFPREQPYSRAAINMTQIEEGRKRGIAASSLALAEDTRIIEASFPIVAKIYMALRQELEVLFAECRTFGIKVNKISDEGIDTVRLRLFETTGSAMDMWLVGWEIGGDSGNTFTMRIGAQAVVPSRRNEWYAGGGQLPPASFNPFFFNLHTFGPQSGNAFPRKGSALLLDSQGALFLCDTTMGIGEVTTTSIPDVVGMVRRWIEDPDVWEALYKYK
ncbi:MAG: protein kinase [Acidobacteriota bacterium]|nr:protein kinase [Acidobacteriota bacterium]